eukprot:171808-Pelagomonas_calceolata.AAC.5
MGQPFVWLKRKFMPYSSSGCRPEGTSVMAAAQMKRLCCCQKKASMGKYRNQIGICNRALEHI